MLSDGNIAKGRFAQSFRFCFLPKGEDPDSLIKAEGKAAFQSRLDASVSLVDFLWMRAISGRDFDTPEARAGLEESLNGQIARIDDRSLQHYYKQVIREKLREKFGFKGYKKGQSKGRSNNNYSNNYRANNNKQSFGAQPSRPITAAEVVREKIILAILINHPDIIPNIEDELEFCDLRDSRLDQVRQEIITAFADDSEITRENLLIFLKNAGFERELELILNENIYIHAGFARPDRDSMEALEGWKDIWTLIYGQKAQNELKIVGQKLASDFTDDVQDHFFQLIRQQEKAAHND